MYKMPNGIKKENYCCRCGNVFEIKDNEEYCQPCLEEMAKEFREKRRKIC